MTYSADMIANEFLDGRFGEISPMKLQKLVYYSHAWSLALFDEPLIRDRIEAWKFGPVVPSLYYEFKGNGNGKIRRFALEFDKSLSTFPPRLPESATRARLIVSKIWALLGEYSAIQLSNMTHSENEPWAKIPKKRPGLAIPNDLIRDCFKALIQN